MPRRKRIPGEAERKAKMRELIQELDINDILEMNALFKEFVGDILENGLEAELDDKLGYSKYDYRSKDTDNSRNGHSIKTRKFMQLYSYMIFTITFAVMDTVYISH